MNNNPFRQEEIKIAVIGGGTGSFTLLSSLKDYTTQIAALVNMADDGGSTGQLRDELGVLPPGDVRQCLVALSHSPEIRELFNYRFDSGALKGHAFGNLFLTALEKMKGDFAEGINLASQILNVTGSVEPITLENITLAMEDAKGEVCKGEFQISDKDFATCRPKMWLEPKTAKANPRALGAIANADMIVIAPGNLYGSLAPALLVDGIGQALKNSKALKVYVSNLMTKPGQTDGFSVTDYANEIERIAGTEFLDVVLFNTERPTEKLIQKYAKEGERPVEYDEQLLIEQPYAAVGAKLISSEIWQPTSKADPIASSRTLIRHDSETVARALIDLYQTYQMQQDEDF